MECASYAKLGFNAENALVVVKKTANKAAKKAGKTDGENTKPNLVEA